MFDTVFVSLTQEMAMDWKVLLICLATTQTKTKNSRTAGL